MDRIVINVDGLGHSTQPIPLAARRGPLLVSGTISGRDRASGQRPDSALDEIRTAFANLQAVVSASGMDLDAVVKVDVALSDPALRTEVNQVWLELFPSADDRPARHTKSGDLPGDLRIQLSVMAFDS
jgi:2-iminobutanoate/2-iminopropanoate deaminase